MKNNLFKKIWFVTCLVGFSVFGQNTITGLKKDYTQSMDSLLLNINKQPINTGILYERIMSFTDLDALKANGAITTSNYDHFIQAWSELHRAAYNPIFSSVATLKNNISLNTNPNVVEIGVINTKMNIIKSGNANSPSLNFVNGRFANIAGINPFAENQVTVIAALKEKITANTITFKLQPSSILQLLGKKIKTLTANFGTGSTYTLIANQIISATNPTVTFTTTGEKEFVFSVVFDDNTTQILKAKMTVVLPTTTAVFRSGNFPAEENFFGTNGVTAIIPFQGYNETNASNGVLEYRTYYNTVTNPGYSIANNTFSVQPKIRKNIIILDGFDPGDVRKTHEGSNSLYALMNYDDDNNPATIPANLVEKLRSAPYGFDVTLVNFPKGADYIERNAMAVVALLQRENTKLAANGSTEQISIIGPSMGGLIARYALAYMEKNNITHNTKLFVSFDSPHLGANIPISTQENLYFFGYYGQKEKAKEKFNENFRSPAARQMLIEQLDGVQQEAPYNNNLWFSTLNGQNNNTRFRNLFNANLTTNGLPNSNGFPINLRKIAIINGTSNGTKTHSEGLTCLQLEAFKTIKWFQIFGTSATTTLKVVTIDDRFLSTPNNWSQTFKGKITFPGKLGQIFGTSIPGPPSVINGWINRNNVNPRGSMDIVPGGTFKTMDIIQNEFSSELFTALTDGDLTNFNWPINLIKHAFIPSVSALAFKNPNFDWSTAINRNLVCDPNNKEIYFDSYFTPSENEEHVFVTAENANWLIKELVGIPQVPNFPIQENAMSGPDFVCSTSTYSFSDICKIPSAVTWSWSSNLQVVSQSAYSINVSKVSDGPGFIKATFQNGQTLTKTIWVGVPKFNNLQPIGSQYGYDPSEPNLSVSPDGDGCNQIRLNAVFDSPNILEYQWEKITTSVAWSVSPNSGYIYIYPQCNQNFSFKVRTRNICGWSEWKEFEYALNRCTIDCNTSIPIINTGLNFILNPNPVTNDILNINVKYNAPWFIIPVNIGNGNNFDITNEFGESNYQLIPNISVNITIFNQLGVPVLQFPNTSVHPTPAELDVSSLQAGTYVVVFEYQGQVESYTIIKN